MRNKVEQVTVVGDAERAEMVRHYQEKQPHSGPRVEAYDARHRKLMAIGNEEMEMEPFRSAHRVYERLQQMFAFPTFSSLNTMALAMQSRGVNFRERYTAAAASRG